MCCQIVVKPLNIELAAALLAIGLFKPQAEPSEGVSLYWRRDLGQDEQGKTIAVKATLERSGQGTGVLRLQLDPPITAYAHHAGRRVQASVALEVATRYAEKVAGEIQQLANVAGCSDDGLRVHTLASYPEVPLLYPSLCAGFREVFVLEDAS